MKLLISITLLLCALAIPAFAQTAPPPAVPNFALPSVVAVGAAFNQLGSPRVNAFASAITPLKQDLGLYTSTTADVIPVSRMDATTGRAFWSFQATLRQGLHKSVYARGNLMLLLGGDAGAAFSQASPSGTNVNLATSVTGTVVYRFSRNFGAIVPVRGLWTPQIGWNLVPQAGVLWIP